MEDATGTISTSPKADAVAVVAGNVKVASILTGEQRDVEEGTTRIVRAPNTPPLDIQNQSVQQMQ
jgi:hypothetical protein